MRKPTDEKSEDFEIILARKSLYKEGEKMAITISPPPIAKNYDLPVKAVIKTFQTYWKRKLDAKFLDYWVKIEMTHYGRLHLHGWAEVHDPLEFAHAVGYFKYKMGIQLVVKRMDEQWLEYCNKDNKSYKPIVLQQTSDEPESAFRRMFSKKHALDQGVEEISEGSQSD